MDFRLRNFALVSAGYFGTHLPMFNARRKSLVINVLQFLSLISSAVTLASSEELLIPHDLPTSEILQPKSSITKEDAVLDIATLVQTFRTAYGGWKEHSRLLEDSIFPSLYKLREARYSSEVLCEHVGKVLDKIPDNHISVLLYKSSRSCGRTDPGKGNVGANIMPPSQKPWGYFEREVKGRKVSILSITHLPNPYYAGWDGFLEKVKEIYATAPALIIDIRGNGGGSDQIPKEMARILYGLDEDSRVPYPESRIVRRQSPEALAVFLNNYGLRILVTRLSGAEPTPDLFRVYEEWKNRYQRALRGELPPEDVIEIPRSSFDARKVFRGPIKILIDSECGSSCESTLEFFESHPSAQSIGQRTGGYVHFGNLGRLWLRNSNLFVGIPTQQHIYLDGRFVEKSGYEPNIVVGPGTDALKVALEEVARHL